MSLEWPKPVMFKINTVSNMNKTQTIISIYNLVSLVQKSKGHMVTLLQKINRFGANLSGLTSMRAHKVR